LLLPFTAEAQSADTTCAITEHDYLDGLGFLANDLSAYVTFLNSNNDVADAAEFCSLGALATRQMWLSIDYAVSTGGVLDVPDLTDAPDPYAPEPYDKIVYVTASEWRDIISRKLAHALYIEVTNTYPWSLTEYTAAELDLLLKPENMFDHSFTFAGAGGFSYLIDHSPKRVHDEVSRILGGSYTKSAKHAMIDLTADWFGVIRHVIAGEPQNATHFDFMVSEGISRSGCHTAARFLEALARAANIPAENENGWITGSTHGAFFAYGSADLFMSHADNMYSGLYGPPSKAYATTATWAKANITPGAGETTKSVSWRQFQARFGHWALNYYDNQYCAEGWSAVVASGFDYFSSPQDDLLTTAWGTEMGNRNTCAPP